MTRRRPPLFGPWLLERCGVDQAVVGDIVERYATGASRRWYVGQVIAAAAWHWIAIVNAHKPRTAGIAGSAAVVIWFLTLAVSGSEPVDLSRRISVQPAASGWVTVPAPTGTRKIVPAFSFVLRNISAEELARLQVNAVFRRDGEESEWGNAFVAAVSPGVLTPGAATAPLRVQSAVGYTAHGDPAEIIEHPQFVDANVSLFARSGPSGWKALGVYPIAHQRLEP
jgi:hypothetical protein